VGAQVKPEASWVGTAQRRRRRRRRKRRRRGGGRSSEIFGDYCRNDLAWEKLV
jgi:hypothetical protein